MVKVELFIVPASTCCSDAKKMVENVLSRLNSDKIEFEIIDSTTKEGSERIKIYHFKEAPQLVVDGDVMSMGFEEWKVAKMIDMKLNPKRSFWQKLFGGQ